MRFIVLFMTLILSSSAFSLEWHEKIGYLRFGKEVKFNVKNGLVDLKALKEQQYYHVQGEVLFFPNEYLSPQFFSQKDFQNLLEQKRPVKVKTWKKAYPSSIETTDATKGTFLLRFVNVEPRLLAIDFIRKFHPYAAYLAQEKSVQKLLAEGDLSIDASEVRNEYNQYTPIISADVKGDFYIIIHANSGIYNSRNTLSLSSFYIGEQLYLSKVIEQSEYFSHAISGGFLVMSIFYTFIFIFRPKDKSSLYLALFSSFAFVLSILYIWNFEINLWDFIDLFTVVNLAGIVCLQHYLVDKLKVIASQRKQLFLFRLFKTNFVLGAIAIALKYYSVAGIIMLFGFFASFVMIGFNFYVGLKHKHAGAGFFAVGTLLNALFQIPIFLGYIGLSDGEPGYYILLANFSMALALALVNAKEFASTYLSSVKLGKDLEKKNQEITNFNKNLEKMVDDKTKEVRALLDYIPQGVLSIGYDGKISKDYSAHLVKILEVSEIGSQCFKSLILDKSHQDDDEKDQTWQAIQAIVGESELSFEANGDKLPVELVYDAGKRKKYLKATWNYQLDDHGDIERLLVTLLDISQEKKLAKQAEKQKREMLRIEELVNIAPSNAAQFFSTSQPLLNEIHSTIKESQETIDTHTLKTLFVNAHTVKGAARTLHLKELTTAIHRMENYYSHCLRESEVPDMDQLLIDSQTTLEVFQLYLDANHSKLNRSSDFSRVPIEREFIESHYELLNHLFEAEPVEVSGILDALKAQNESLTKIIFEQLPVIFLEYEEKAEKIAKDLGKAIPQFDLDIDDLPVTPEAKVLLDKCMIHILRNILDHGIEDKNQRIAVGKPESGTIMVEGKPERDAILLKISDDGRGLAIARLKDLGIKKGVLKPDATLESIANSIFISGLSTATSISEISGRGVGMNAVKTFLDKVGGSICITLQEPKDENAEFYSFTFEILLPLHPKEWSQVS